MNDAPARHWPWQAALCTPDRKRKTVLLVGAAGQIIGPKEGLLAARGFSLSGADGPALISARAHDGRWGFIDTEGGWRVPPRFEDTRNAAPNGFARFKQGGLWGFMRMTGEVLIEPRFEDCRPFRHGVAAVRLSARDWRFIDEQVDSPASVATTNWATWARPVWRLPCDGTSPARPVAWGLWTAKVNG